MEFISQGGIRLDYWFTVGDVISVNSWTYRGERHREVWIRNMDGREWSCGGYPLNVSLTRGQRIAFAWCAVEGNRDSQLVAVRNCSTGVCHVLSDCIAIAVGVHRHGRQAFAWLAALAVLEWAAEGLIGRPGWLPHVPITTLVLAVLGGSVIGFVFSCFRDPDPERVIDRNVQVALGGIEHAWRQT